MYTKEQKKLINEVFDDLKKLNCNYSSLTNIINKFKEKNGLNKTEIEVGKYYKSNRGEVLFINKCNNGYGIDYFGDFVEMSDGYIIDDFTTEITREEFNSKMLEYAEKKYPKGTKFKSIISSHIITSDKIEFGIFTPNEIYSNGRCMFKDGKWAEIVEEEIVLTVPKGAKYRVEEV